MSLYLIIPGCSSGIPGIFAVPTLSQQIRVLETMPGAKLLARRTKRAVALTHSGKRFVFAGGDLLSLPDRRGDFSAQSKNGPDGFAV
jgi:DNA-binding transcriptional LysR family regulator